MHGYQNKTHNPAINYFLYSVIIKNNLFSLSDITFLVSTVTFAHSLLTHSQYNGFKMCFSLRGHTLSTNVGPGNGGVAQMREDYRGSRNEDHVSPTS